MNGPDNHQLILGASARADGPNVSARLSALAALSPLVADHLVDIGAGEGSFAPPLAQFCRHLTLVDIQATALIRARSRMAHHPGPASVTYVVSRAEAIALADASCDAAFLIEVLDHVADPAATLREAARVLRPGGRLFVTVPNRAFPFETHPVRLFGRRVSPLYAPFLPWFDWLHRRCATARVFSPASLRQLAEQAGFTGFQHDMLMPPFENIAILRLPSRILARTALRRFGVSIVAVLQKPA